MTVEEADPFVFARSVDLGGLDGYVGASIYENRTDLSEPADPVH